MNANLTVQDLFKLILFLLGMGVGVYLIIFLSNVNGIIKQIRRLANENHKELDETIKSLPEISNNINKITKETHTTLENLTPEINELLHNVNLISGKIESVTEVIDETTHKVTNTVDRVTENLGDTLEIVSDSITDTALAFKFNAQSIGDYIKIAKEIVEILKQALYKK